MPLSVIIPVRNEEPNIQHALKSVTWAGEIWVVDSQSTDRTVEIAREYTDKVVQFCYQGGWPKKKNWALDNLPFANEWILILDADEWVTPELRAEIVQAICSDRYDGYYLRQLYVFLGRPLRHCHNSVWKLNLFKHRLGRFERIPGTERLPDTGDNEVHEHVVLNGCTGYLRNPYIHDDQRSLYAFVERHNRYSTWETQVYRSFSEDKPSWDFRGYMKAGPAERKRVLKYLWVRLPGRPLLRFVWLYFVKRGFLDGRQGLIFCTLMAIHEFHIAIKMWEIQQAAR